MAFLDLSQIPSLSFRYGGQSSQAFWNSWPRQETSETLPGGRVTRITCQDPSSGLRVTLTLRRFDAFPALDWLAEFENTGAQDTPLIEDILPLDVTVPIPAAERLRLHHANGSFCQMDDFLPHTTELLPATDLWLAPLGGRSSNGVLPFMNLQRAQSGLILAVGWSGQWTAGFVRSGDSLRLAAGMQRTALILHPGERIRTPRILLLPWEGADPEQATNQLRRLLADVYLPRIDGKLVLPPVAQCLQGYFYLTGQAGEQFEMKALPKAASLGAEVYWLDACWYGAKGQWWQEVGSWAVNTKKFPNGLKPISDAARQAGMQFLLWFEPERVRPNSLLHREHPEFLLASQKDPDNLLYNLGDPQALAYMTELISKLIAENRVNVYRQDFNFDPLPYWQAADQPGRVGLSEIRHVEGLYALWDELRRRHPGLWIDNCASGGRRIDLETLSRSLPLWPSDFSDTIGLRYGLGLHVGDQCITAGLARWMPLFGGGVWNFTPYSTRSQIIGGFTFGFHIEQKDFEPDETPVIVQPNDILARGKTLLDDDFPMDPARAAIAEWKSIRPYFLGDFYLLLPLTIGYHDWCAWQFHRADLQAGAAALFRRHRSPFPSMQVSLRCVDPAARYRVSLSPGYQEAPRQVMNGAELVNLTVEIPEAPGSLLLRYEKIQP